MIIKIKIKNPPFLETRWFQLERYNIIIPPEYYEYHNNRYYYTFWKFPIKLNNIIPLSIVVNTVHCYCGVERKPINAIIRVLRHSYINNRTFSRFWCVCVCVFFSLSLYFLTRYFLQSSANHGSEYRFVGTPILDAERTFFSFKDVVFFTLWCLFETFFFLSKLAPTVFHKKQKKKLTTIDDET